MPSGASGDPAPVGEPGPPRPAPVRRAQRVFVLGATGTIGRETVRALVRRGHEVVCLVRPRGAAGPQGPSSERLDALAGAELRRGEAGDPASLRRDGFRGERFDALVSCLASRTGSPREVWAIDHQAHVDAFAAAGAAGVGQVVLLSAICVQRPRLALQHAKLACEQALIDSGLAYSIVRPTAFFKSLSGQVDRVRSGRPYLVFGDGRLTACKPIAEADLGEYLAACLDDPTRRNRILPIGGPGAAITPRQQGEHLFALLGRPPRFRQVPVGLLSAIATVLEAAGRLVPGLRDKAEFARIGHYYATESMLVLDPESGRYDATATPSTGTRTLFDHYADLLAGTATHERGEHAVF
jgi:divinyl chlorophyllide a 8-vinyl-reductase